MTSKQDKSIVLVIDDELGVGKDDPDTINIEKSLIPSYSVVFYDSGESLENALDDGSMHLNSVKFVLLDMRFAKRGQMQGPSILKKIKQIRRDLSVIMLTVSREVKDVVRAFNYGADDYIAKPILPDELLFKTETLDSLSRLKRIIGFAGGSSKKVFRDIHNASETDARVFIQGETGTGKELAAKAIHYFSRRADKSFVPLYCGGLTETLLESELFGHKRGAFTGAVVDRKGLIEEAHQGTLFLDEICDVPLPVQTKVLRVLQEGEIRRVGETQTKEVDIRVISATNRDVVEEMEKGNFRRDLFYRLNTYPIHLPALRERKEDIPILAGYFINEYNRKYKADVEDIEDKALAILRDYQWPGNIRELEHVIERCVILDRDKKILTKNTIFEVIREAELVGTLEAAKLKHAAKLIKACILEGKHTLPETVKEMEREVILSVYEEQDRNLTKTTKILGIEGQRTTLKRKYHLP